MSAGDQIQTTKKKSPNKDASKSEIEYTGYLSPEALKSLPVATTVGNHDADNANYTYHFNRTNASVELLTAGLQVGQAGDALIQKPDLAVPDGIAEIHHAVHGIGHEIAEGIIKGNAAGFGVGVEIRHVHPEGDTVKWLRHSGKEPEQLCPRPRVHVDFMHGRFLHPPCFYPAHRTAL